MYFEKWVPVDLLRLPTHVQDIGMSVYTGDNLSVRIGAKVTKNGVDEDVTGTVSGYVILPNGATIATITGASSGNLAWIDLPEDAFALPGRIQIAIRVTDGTTKTVLLAATATVRPVATTTAYDPDGEIPTWDEIEAKIEAIDDAVEQASSMVSYAAQTGKTDAQKAQARTNIGAASTADVSGLESTFDDAITKTASKNLFDGEFVNGYLGNDGAIVSHDNWITTKNYINVTDLTSVTTSGYRISLSARETMNMFYLCTYDSSKNLIANVGQVNNTYVVGSGVRYIRFSIHPDYYNEIQVESGSSATGYVPYSIEYEFSDSPYVKNITIDKFNLYSKDNNITGSYITSSGAISSSSSAIRCKVPCSKGDVLSICKTTSPYYASGNGLMIVCDNSDTILTSVDMSEYATIQYNGTEAVQYEVVSDNAAYISFNVKLSSWDASNNTIVTKRNINTEFTGDYISEVEGKKLLPVSPDLAGKWHDKKWVAVGDSLTAVNVRTTIHYFDYVSDATGIKVINMGDSGSGYAAEKDLGTAFYQRISSVPTDADVITIFGSFNDLGSGVNLGTASDTGTTTIGGCINTCLDNLFTAYPLAVVGVVAPTPWVNANPTDEPNNASNYVELLKTICENRSIPFLDLFHSSLLRPWDEDFRELAYTKDEGNGVHPDETGHKLIAPRFEAFLGTLLL